MTLAPTHFTLQGIILWQVMKKEDKQHFLTNHPWMILLLNIVANIPDLDDKIGLHRGPVHSLFLALLFLLITGLIYQQYKKKSTKNNDLIPRRIRVIIYVESMWLLHILLDMNTPIALFWPLTDQVYTVNFVLLISIFPIIVLGIVLLPYEILGLALDVQTESFITGLKFYLTNLTLEERRQVFPTEILAIPIFDFIIHVLIAISWILIVGKPLIQAFWSKYFEARWNQWTKKNRKALLKTMYAAVHWEWWLLMILIAFSGVILTNGTGPHKQIPVSLQEELKISPTEFSPFHVITYERIFQLIPPPSPDVEITYSVEVLNKTNVTDYQLLLFVLPIPSVELLSSRLTSLYRNANLSSASLLSSFQSSYKDVIFQIIPLQNKVTTMTSKQGNITGKIVPPTHEKLFNVGMIISDWSLAGGGVQGFSITLNIHYTITQHQEGIFYFGYALQVLGGIASLVAFPAQPLLKGIKEAKKAAINDKE